MHLTKRSLFAIAALAFAGTLLAAGGSAGVTVNVTTPRQVIRGFGAASVWQGQLSAAENDALFTTIGLSIERVQIDATGNWADEIANAKAAQARGALVFASPWSPPAYMKDNNSTVGGSLLPQHYGDYVAWLNNFASNIPGIYAVSVQNEPNINVSYDSCTWTEAQLYDFIVHYGGGFTARLMMPETFNYLPTYSDSILADPVGAANTSICAYHWYGANKNALWTQAYNLGKDIWMTEHYSNDQSIGGAVSTAIEMHKQLTINYANAYVWWYATAPDCNLVNADGSINPRGYVMGQFAKFVRPGSIRVDASGGGSSLYVSAYTNAGKLVIVAINNATGAATRTFTINGGSATTLSSYTTSANQHLQAGPTYTVTNGTFSATLPGTSVTTFVQ
jgi:glucuronoarabinoxylan endo-1,4-beta-xylanase